MMEGKDDGWKPIVVLHMTDPQWEYKEHREDGVLKIWARYKKVDK